MPLPEYPLSPAGGLVVLEYFIAGHPQHIGLHVQEIGDVDLSGDLPDWQYNNNGTVFFGLFEPTSNESSVGDTVNNFVGKLKPLYSSEVSFSIKSLWKATELDTAGNAKLQEVFPTPAIADGAGTAADGTSPTASEWGRNSQHILACKSGMGGRFRVTLVGADPVDLIQPTPVSPNASGTNYEKIVAYLQSKDCRILGRDGGKPSGAFRMHVGVSAKLRRSNKWA
jgi:hypothetical protein